MDFPKTPVYGKKVTTEILDEHGSIKQTTSNYLAGSINPPIRVYYEHRIPVKSQKEEHEAYLKFSDSLLADKTKLDSAFKTQRTHASDEKGVYYIVFCFSQLEYK